MPRAAPDLAAVDELCRLAVAARRLGCRVRLTDVDPALAELLELAGVGDLVDAADRPDARPTVQEADLR